MRIRILDNFRKCEEDGAAGDQEQNLLYGATREVKV
jgi:hypothetical protein